MPASLVGGGLVVAVFSLFSRGFFSSSQRPALTKDSIARMRKEYSEESIDESKLLDDPLALFDKWLEEAVNSKLLEPNAMCLSTVCVLCVLSVYF